MSHAGLQAAKKTGAFMALARVAGIATLITMPIAACVQILGIEQPPTVVGSDAAATDAGLDVVCSRSDLSPCRPGCPHILCDDFESQPIAKNWQAYGGVLQPAVLGEGGLTQGNGVVGGGVFAWCTAPANRTCLAGMTHVYRRPPDAGGRPRGYELIADVRLQSVERSDANPQPDLTQVLALLSGEGQPSGVVLSAADGHFFLAGINNALISRVLIEPQGFTDKFPQAFIWLRVSLFAGEPAGAASAGYRDCPADAETVFAARVDPLAQLCRAAGPSEAGTPFDLTGFLLSPLALVGVASTSAGPAATAYDNVQLNLVP